MLLGVAILSGNCHPLCVTGHYRIVITHNAHKTLSPSLSLSLFLLLLWRSLYCGARRHSEKPTSEPVLTRVFKYRCSAPPKSSRTVKLPLSSKFQPQNSSEQETPAVYKQTDKQTDRQTDRQNLLRHQEKFVPISCNCHRGKPAGGSSKKSGGRKRALLRWLASPGPVRVFM